jgi:hypothetical protein
MNPLVQGDQLAGMPGGQRTKEDRVDRGEGGGVGADAGRQGQDGDDREPRAAAQSPEGQANAL